MIKPEALTQDLIPIMEAFTHYAKPDDYFPLFCTLSILKPFPFQMKIGTKNRPVFNGFNTN